MPHYKFLLQRSKQGLPSTAIVLTAIDFMQRQSYQPVIDRTQAQRNKILILPGELKNKIIVQSDLDISRLSVKLQPDGFDH
jgi:hypothetical protein